MSIGTDTTEAGNEPKQDMQRAHEDLVGEPPETNITAPELA